MDLDVLPLEAVREAEVAVVTAATFAVKVAEVAVAGMVREPGTVTEPLLLARATLRPPEGADPESVTVHESDSAPVMDVLPHANALTVGAVVEPVPLKLTVADGALLETASCPETEPAAFGLNWTESTSCCPGFSVTGKLPPETVNPVPEIESALMDTAVLPLEVRVTDFVTAVPTETFPNASDVELMLIEGVPTAELDPLSLIEAVFDVEPCVAVRVTVCEAVTAATAAEKEAVVAPEGTETDAGTVTAVLLLARFTARPVLGAAALSLTEQLSVPAPIMEVLEHDKLDRDGVPEFDPLPWSLVVVEDWVAFVVRLVDLMLRVPVVSVVELALKLTLTLRLCPARSVVGRDGPVTVKAVVELLTSVISSAVDPGFSMEIFCVAPVPILTSPKSRDVGVVTTAFEALGVNVLESEPQPVRPAPTSMEQAMNAIGSNLRQRERALDLHFSALRTGCSLDIRYEEEVRFLLIRRHLAKSFWCFGQPMQKAPLSLSRGRTCRSCAG